MCLKSIVYKEKVYKVKFIHDRCWYQPTTDELHMGFDGYILPKGGRTTAFITDNEGVELASGWADCSKKDVYDKKLGRMIATGRLLKALKLNTKLALEKQ